MPTEHSIDSARWMRAMLLDAHGEPDLLRAGTLPMPEPGPDDIRVRVQASSVNPADLRARMASARPRAIARRFPLVLGYDFVGCVDAMGEQVTGLSEGDRVFGSPSLLAQGAHAEYVIAPAGAVAAAPRDVALEQAGAAPLVCVTAWNALVERARVRAGQTVLIHGGGGGVGHVAIQLAKQRGCRVLATAGRDASKQLCHVLGADAVIDYRHDDLASSVRRHLSGGAVDVVLDTVGGETLTRSAELLAPLGHLVTVVPTEFVGAAMPAFMRSATLHYEMIGARLAYGIDVPRVGETLREIAALLEQRALRIHVQRTFALAELADAHRLLASGQVTGKLAIEVAQ